MPSPPPDWVKALKPGGPQGSELLAQERAQSNVDVQKLSELLHTKEHLELQDKLVKMLQPEKVFDKSQNHSLGRVERLKRSLAKAKRLQQLAEQHQWSMEELHAANELIGEPTPYGLHASMFLVCILSLSGGFSFPRLPRQGISNADRSPPSLGDPPRTRQPRTAQALP